MAGPAIKICGVTTAAALDAAVAAHADHVGFNFCAESPRYLAWDDAAALAERASARIGIVGLFVDANDAAIGEGVHAGRLTALQFHGGESPQRCAEARSRFGLPVWKAVAVGCAADVERADAYAGAADLILFDAKTPGGALPGGIGLAFDWSLVAGRCNSTPWGLAGGLHPQNVAEAVRITGTPLVDTSSGVESAAGVKSPDQIAAFCRAIRSI